MLRNSIQNSAPLQAQQVYLILNLAKNAMNVKGVVHNLSILVLPFGKKQWCVSKHSKCVKAKPPQVTKK